jgi:hypothetical protein
VFCLAPGHGGGANVNSDTDYVLPLGAADFFKVDFAFHGWQITENKYYVSGFYARDPATGNMINVTGCKPEDFEAWKRASEMMKHAGCGNKMLKRDRHILFETILAILKQALM